jgi:hypothetical protein
VLRGERRTAAPALPVEGSRSLHPPVVGQRKGQGRARSTRAADQETNAHVAPAARRRRMILGVPAHPVQPATRPRAEPPERVGATPPEARAPPPPRASARCSRGARCCPSRSPALRPRPERKANAASTLRPAVPGVSLGFAESGAELAHGCPGRAADEATEPLSWRVDWGESPVAWVPRPDEGRPVPPAALHVSRSRPSGSPIRARSATMTIEIPSITSR